MRRILPIFFLLLGLTPLHAMTAEELVHYCSTAKLQTWSDEQMIRYQFCNGYVQGFVDAMRIEESLVDPKTMKAQLKKTICLPKSEVSTNELMLVFVKFTEDHPKLLHEDVSTVLHNALVKAYPCGMKSKTE